MKTAKLSTSQKEQGSLLKDLLSSISIPLKRETIPKCAIVSTLPLENATKGQNKGHPCPCSICGDVNKKCQMLTLIEIEQLKELVQRSTLSVEVTGLISQWNICPHCSRILEKLRILKGEIEQITHALKTVIRIQINKNGTFHPEQMSGLREEEVGMTGCDPEEHIREPTSSISGSGNDYPEQEAEILADMELEMTDIDETDDDAMMEILEIDAGGEGSVKDQGEGHIPINTAEGVNTTRSEATSPCPTNDPPPNLDQCNTRPVCSQCGTSFSRLAGLIRHRRNVHHEKDPLKESQQEVNSRQAGPRSSVNSHPKKQRGGGKKVKVKCHLCLMTLSSTYSLGRHLRSLVHKEGTKSRKIKANGEVSFGCNRCHADFTRLIDLLSHKKAHPKGDGRSHTKQIECEDDDLGEINSELFNAALDSSTEIKIDPDDEVDQKPILFHTEIELVDEQQVRMNDNVADNPTIEHDQSDSEDVGTEEVNPTSKNDSVTEMTMTGRAKRVCRAKAEELLCSLAKEDNDNAEEDGSDVNMESETGSDSEGSESNSEETDGEEVAKLSKTKSPGRGPGNWRKWPRMKGPPIDPLECAVCGEQFSNSKLLKVHQAQHPVNQCDICDRKYSSTLAYSRHMESLTHHLGKTGRKNEGGVITFVCQDCDGSFSTVRILALHKFRVHSEQGKAAVKMRKQRYKAPECGPCQQVFKSHQALKLHLISDRHAEMIGEEAVAELEKLKTFECDQCHKRYPCERQLRRHAVLHTSGTVICEICGKRLKGGVRDLEHHIANIHSDKPKQKTIKRKPNLLLPPQDKPFPCKKCGKRFTAKARMKDHFKTIHEGFRLKCHHCSREFLRRETLKTHCISAHGEADDVKIRTRVRAKKERYFCDICSKSFMGKDQMAKHVELKHFPEKDHCPYGCSDKMENEQEWRLHLETCKSEKLTEASKCFCFFCGDVFSTQLLKIDHHLRSHTTFPCEFCDRSFTQKGILAYHVYEHEESKPWLCPKCGKRFRQRYNLDIHSKAVCGEDETAKQELIAKRRELHRIYRNKAKPYKCSQCPKAFVEERRLEDHTRKVHGKKKKNDNSMSDEERETNDEENLEDTD